MGTPASGPTVSGTWTLTRANPVPVEATIDCFTFEANFNYLPGDLVCIEELVFECNAQPLSDECATTSPLRSPDGSVPVWITRTETANPVDPPTLGDAIECTDWLLWSKGNAGESSSEVAFYLFGLGDYACNNGRVFECAAPCTTGTGSDNCSSQSCTYLQPGTAQES